jgi:hypothetical protein
MSSRLLRIGGLALSTLLVSASSAFALGKPVAVATPYETTVPSVTVDSGGNAVIAWANTKDQAGAPDLVQYCVLPADGTACAHSGSFAASDSATYIDAVQVLDDSGTLVILADVYGAAGNQALDYEPVQEWQSTDDGATWATVNGGLSVSSGIIDADTEPLSGVIMPGTGALGFGWDTAAGAPTFNAFALAGPPECSRKTCAAGFSTLEPATNPDVLSNEPGQFASISSGPNAGVMGVFDSLFTNGPLGCAQSFGTAFVYGSGGQSPSNSYNVSPGQPNSAWRVPVTQASCDTEYAAVGGGPSGFGILDDNLGTRSVMYQRFDSATDAFDVAPVTVNGGGGELDGAVSQDSSGGVYATYLLGGDGGPLTLSYSADGGKTFTSAPIDSDSDGRIAQASNAVNATGQGWATWTDNGQVFAQSFSSADTVVPASVASSATTDGTTVNLDVTCASFPCTITLTLTAPETVTVHASRAAAALPAKKKGKTKLVTLGTGTFKINSKKGEKLSLKLSKAGRSFLKSKHGHLKVSAKINETIEHVSKLTTKQLVLTIHPSTKKHKK